MQAQVALGQVRLLPWTKTRPTQLPAPESRCWRGARGPASLLRAASQVFGPGRGALRGQCREDTWEGGAFGKALCQ